MSDGESDSQDITEDITALLPSLKETRKVLRKELLDPYNRLHSIDSDSRFVDEVHARLKLPVVANQRCGAWYTDPAKSLDVWAYFKSTDGHTNQWDFNLRRANLRLIPYIVQHEGIILVDSTRRGKRYPDALSKTVPIWCAVLNAAVNKLSPSPDLSSDLAGLHTPVEAVSRSEHSQIASRIDAWSDQLINSAYDLSGVLLLGKPLRPVFLSPSSPLSEASGGLALNFHPIVCLSASRCLSQDSMNFERNYVQGSGDDHELWSMGLSAKMYWTHRDAILSLSRQELVPFMQDLITSASAEDADRPAISIKGTPLVLHTQPLDSPLSGIFLCTGADLPDLAPEIMAVILDHSYKNYDLLFKSMPSIVRNLQQSTHHPMHIAFSLQLAGTGPDCVMIIALCYLVAQDQLARATKSAIRKHLQVILESAESSLVLNPSRAALKRTNEYLLSGAYR